MTAQASPFHRWLLTWAWLGLGLTLATALLGWSGWTRQLDMAIHDSAQSIWQSAPPNDIVVVAIDEPSLAALGRWPWKRAMHASLLDKLNEAQPQAILLHVLFTEPDADPLQDQALAQAMKKCHGKLVLPMGFSKDPSGETVVLQPIALLAAQARLGHSDAFLDVDGVMRHAYLSAGMGSKQWPHLAQVLVNISPPQSGTAMQPMPSLNLPASESGVWQRHLPIALRFFGGAGSVQTVSYMDVLSGAVPASTFDNKVVLVGATAHGLGDTFRTPVSANGKPMASVEIVAQMVAMLRQSSLLQWVPAWAVGLVSAALMLVLIGLSWTGTPRMGLLITILFIVLLPLVSVVWVRMGLWFAPATFMVMAALSYPVWSWRRLEVASGHLSDQLMRLGHALPLPATSPANNWLGHLERQAQAIESIHLRMEDAYRLVDRLIQQLPCAVVLTDKDGCIIRTNSALLKMVHANDPKALLGARVVDVLSAWQPNDAPNWSFLLSKLVQAEHPAIHTTVKHARGDVYLASIVSVAQEPTLACQGAIICLTDITASKQTEKQRDELLGFIAHDIRSPQASLLALVELHQFNASSMPVPELLKHVDALARNTIALSEELIQVMHSESSPLQMRHLNLVKVIESACELSLPQAMSKEVSLAKQWPQTLQAWVWADESQVQRALMNLLSNAIRFSPNKGEVRVTLEQSKNSPESEWVISVHDQGEGISADNLSKLFRRYSRLNTADSNQMYKGFGLGLVFVETVFKRHGGQVHVRSELGQGSVFSCSLPERQPPAPLTQPK